MGFLLKLSLFLFLFVAFVITAVNTHILAIVEPLSFKFKKGAVLDASADIGNQRLDKMDIVYRRQPIRQKLSNSEEMMKVGAGEMPARITTAH